MASRRGTGRRSRRSRRGQSEKPGRGKGRVAIVAGVAAIALVAIGAATMFMLSGSANEQHQEATTSAGLSPINAETGIAVGDKVPDFDIQLNNGNIVSAANLVAEGKPTFYFFFATW